MSYLLRPDYKANEGFRYTQQRCAANAQALKSATMMVGEQRLWLAVVLQGIAESRPAVISGIRSRGVSNEFRTRIGQEAKEWMDSDAFRECCEMAGIDCKVARLLDPDKAMRAYHMLICGNSDAQAMWSAVNQQPQENNEQASNTLP